MTISVSNLATLIDQARNLGIDMPASTLALELSETIGTLNADRSTAIGRLATDAIEAASSLDDARRRLSAARDEAAALVAEERLHAATSNALRARRVRALHDDTPSVIAAAADTATAAMGSYTKAIRKLPDDWRTNTGAVLEAGAGKEYQQARTAVSTLAVARDLVVALAAHHGIDRPKYPARGISGCTFFTPRQLAPEPVTIASGFDVRSGDDPETAARRAANADLLVVAGALDLAARGQFPLEFQPVTTLDELRHRLDVLKRSLSRTETPRRQGIPAR